MGRLKCDGLRKRTWCCWLSWPRDSTCYFWQHFGVWRSVIVKGHTSLLYPSPRWCDFKPDFALARNKKKTVKKIVQSEKKRKSPKPSVYETLGNSQVVKQAPCNWQLSPLNSIDARFTISLFTSIFSVARNTRCALCAKVKGNFRRQWCEEMCMGKKPYSPPLQNKRVVGKKWIQNWFEEIPLISSQLVNKWSEMVSVNNDFI